MLWTADLETTTDPNDCRVWAWGLCEIGKPEYFIHGTDLNSMMQELIDLSEFETQTLYFHNEKFDGTFILVWLFENGYSHIINKKELQSKQFSTLISDGGLFYNITIMIDKNKSAKKSRKIIIYDSLKILPFSVKDVAKGFGLPIQKGEIDYNKPRPIGYIPDKNEIDYLHNDVAIMSMALHELFQMSLTQMTQGSNALFDFKRRLGKDVFDKNFPVLPYEIDQDIRKAYKGGWVYLKKDHAEKDIADGVVFDNNSIYPSRMHDCPLPYGMPVYFSGEYVKDEIYTLYVQRLRCNFTLKKKHLPTIQIKHSIFNETEYLESSDGEDVILTLTNIDLELFLKHYDVFNIEYISGWKFKAHIGFFNEYIDHWTYIKISSKKAKNKAMYTLAKLMLNALYGKFAANPNVCSKIPYYDDGIIRYRSGVKEIIDSKYVPVAVFVTSHARYLEISTAQNVYDRFIYGDTDSIHLTGRELPTNIEIDDTALGKWKHESTFRKARFLHAKSYIEDTEIDEDEYNKLIADDIPNVYIDNGQHYHLAVTCAGLPSRCHRLVTWENFKVGFAITPDNEYAKLKHTNVKGGIVLKPTDFAIKERRTKGKVS